MVATSHLFSSSQDFMLITDTVDTPVDKVTEGVVGTSMDSREVVTEEEMDTAAEAKVEIACLTLVLV
jgi:hypothetical protein